MAILAIASVAVRALAIGWLTRVAPYPGFDFHPDVTRVIRLALDFANQRPWNGYPVAMATQLFIAKQALDHLLHANVDPVILLRWISLLYSVATIVLVGAAARALSGPSVALLSAALLALAPMQVVNSVFGTADAAAVFWSYAAFVFGWRYARSKNEPDFLFFTAAIGVAIATKFFIPLFVPLALILFAERSRLWRFVLAGLVLAGSFSIASFFNYTPWDMKRLLHILRVDELVVAGGLGPLEETWHYSLTTIRALGFACFLLFAVGALHFARAWLKSRPRSLGAALGRAKAFLASPAAIPASALAAHAAAIVMAQGFGERQILIFLPVMCYVAAHGLVWITQSLRQRWAAAVAIVAVLAYQAYLVQGVIRMFQNDVRSDLAHEISTLSPAEPVVTFSNYSLVTGARKATEAEEASLEPSGAYFATCDLEYSRYFESDDPDKIFHDKGGSKRTAFFRDLFAGRSPYELVYEVQGKPYSVEERLGDAGVLADLGSFTANHCALFKKKT